MKTNICIDAGNLYFGLLKGHPEYKWLDLVALSRTLLRDDHAINEIKYFTSNIKTFPHDQSAVERQNIYLQALMAYGGVKILFGRYNKNKIWLPALDSRCLNCEVSGDTRLLHVMRFEEKRTDVNIVSEMLRDAYTTNTESFVLISGDSDFITPLDIIRHDLGKQIVVFNPRTRKSDLSSHATFYRDIPRDLPKLCQLPDTIPIGTHGNVIRRPAAWAGL